MLNTYLISPTLPSAEELPDSDDKPVDNELQTLIPTLLSDMLSEHWQTRMDWFWGINMGIYHTTGSNPRTPLVPDAFLSLGVERWRAPNGRLSYIVWLEKDIVPTLALEIVSHTYGGEYDDKMSAYARLGVLYYAIYNPEYHKRRRRDPLEVYCLVNRKYVRQLGEPVWLPKLGLQLGRAIGIYKKVRREWLYWYDAEGIQLPTPTDISRQALLMAGLELRQKEQAWQELAQEQQQSEQLRQQLQQEQQLKDQALQQLELERIQKDQALQQFVQERQRAERLVQLLREKGIDLGDI